MSDTLRADFRMTHWPLGWFQGSPSICIGRDSRNVIFSYNNSVFTIISGKLKYIQSRLELLDKKTHTLYSIHTEIAVYSFIQSSDSKTKY